MKIDWSGIALIPVSADDALRINAWQNDPILCDLIMGFRGPVQLETTLNWIRSLGGEQNLRSRVVFAIRQAGAIKGIVQLQSIDWIQRTTMLGVYVGDQQSRGTGLGMAAAALILDYAFTGLDLDRVALNVIALNTSACKLYEKLGFSLEGTMRAAYLSMGVRKDVLLYGILKPEWRFAFPDAAHRLVNAD